MWRRGGSRTVALALAALLAYPGSGFAPARPLRTAGWPSATPARAGRRRAITARACAPRGTPALRRGELREAARSVPECGNDDECVVEEVENRVPPLLAAGSGRGRQASSRSPTRTGSASASSATRSRRSTSNSSSRTWSGSSSARAPSGEAVRADLRSRRAPPPRARLPTAPTNDLPRAAAQVRVLLRRLCRRGGARAARAVPLTASAGYLFGVAPGTAIVLLAAAVAASVSLLIGRTIGRDWILQVASGNDRFRAPTA